MNIQDRLRPLAGQLEIQGQTPTLIIAGPDPENGDDRVMVSAPAFQSQSSVTRAGDISLRVTGGDAGQLGEPTVLHIFQSKLKQEALGYTLEAGSNQHGEDGILVVGSQRRVVQIVTGVTDPSFWTNARKGSASRRFTIAQAAEILNTAIVKKAERTVASQALKTVLLIDARQAAPLSSSVVLSEFVDRFGDPAAKYGFSSVWVVGPTANLTARLGGALP